MGSESSEDECMSVDSDVERLHDDGIASEDEYKSAEGDSETIDDDSDYSDGIASEDDDDDEYEGDVPEEDDGYGDMAEDDHSDKLEEDDRWKKRYKVLIEEDIRKLQQEDITQVSNTLSIPRVSTAILLRNYNWDMDKAQDAWFAEEERVRQDVGLLDEQVVPIRNWETIIKCGICFDDFSPDGMCAATCGHLFCNLCWTQYVSINISDGPGCLMLRCPDPSCAASVGQDMVSVLVSDEHKKKYSSYLCNSYVEDKKNIKWCPGPGCEFAIEFVTGSTSYDVVCKCGHRFCWNCVEDAHRPVDCDTVHKWILKNASESENVTWILANSKSCPKCKKPIEKNDGCMHMTCSCRFQFCWLCLGDWSTHGKHTGGNYKCNVYARVKAEGRYDEEEKIKEMAKDYSDRYIFYYERFVENQKSRLKAVDSLQKTRAEYLVKFSDKYTIPEAQLEFITDAWLQIIECRRVPKWTYVYGYYLPETEHTKKPFFEYSQGQAQSELERLHQCAEMELQSYLNEDAPADFNPFRTKLLGLTCTTRNFFETLVRALENGLSDVDDSHKLNYSDEEIKGRDMTVNVDEKSQARFGTASSAPSPNVPMDAKIPRSRPVTNRSGLDQFIEWAWALVLVLVQFISFFGSFFVSELIY